MKRLIVAAFFLTSTVLMGQVLEVGNFTHVVENLDRSIEFYRDAVGLEMTGAPGPHAFSANVVLSSLYDAPGAQSRMASFKLPESDVVLEIMEFQGLNATPVQSRFFDPGAITLTLPVQDLETVKTRLHRIKGLEWISAFGTGQVTVREPGGIFVTLSQPLGRGNRPPPENIVSLAVTVEDLDRTTRFYWEVLGFNPVNFRAPNYADRKPVKASIHDPGAGVRQLRVGDFDAMVKALKAAGATVVSAGGEPVSLGRNRAVILRDMNNFFLQVSQSAPAQGAAK